MTEKISRIILLKKFCVNHARIYISSLSHNSSNKNIPT